MADVFISYSKADRAIAEALADDLKAACFDVWWDFELYAGDDFHDMIRSEIAKAKATIVIWSETAVASRWVRGEAQEADDVGTLIATHVPGFDPRKVPINFRALHCESVSSRDRITASVERKVGRSRAVPPAQPRLTAPPDKPADPLAELRACAESGDAEAQWELGAAYAFGLGVVRDAAAAVLWYRRAAHQGDAEAQYSLGVSYQTGRGVDNDDVEAVRWYRCAADQGHAKGLYALGGMYESGRGVAKDDVEAVRWYLLAAEEGHPGAQYQLGVMYGIGQGVAKDDAEAVRRYRLAAAQGQEDAKKALKQRGLT